MDRYLALPELEWQGSQAGWGQPGQAAWDWGVGGGEGRPGRVGWGGWWGGWPGRGEGLAGGWQGGLKGMYQSLQSK